MHFAAFLTQHALFTTRQFAVRCNCRIDSSSRRLARLADQDALVQVTRGVWAQPEHPLFTPYAAAPFLLGNEQGYVSFLSAMHRHGLVSQVPGSIQVATTGHSRFLLSPVGRYEFLRVKPEMMIEGVATSSTTPPYAAATAEKALLDTLYIATRKRRRFASLPELELAEIDQGRLRTLLNAQVPWQPIRGAIKRRLSDLLGSAWRD